MQDTDTHFSFLISCLCYKHKWNRLYRFFAKRLNRSVIPTRLFAVIELAIFALFRMT